MMKLGLLGNHDVSWASVRYGLVCLTWGLVTYAYVSFHHALHWQKISFGHDRHNQTTQQSRMQHETNGTDHQHDSSGHSEHGRGGPFEKIFDKFDGYLLFGLTFPLAALALVSVLWNPRPSDVVKTNSADKSKGTKSSGEVNVAKWTIIWFVLPLYVVMLDGAIGHSRIFSKSGESSSHHTDATSQFHFSKWVQFCNTFLSPSGYAAAWALALFLIPVTRHSPILDWLRVTPVQALAFHRITGWVGFWNSCFHGFVHLQHLMGVLNPTGERTFLEQLKFLLVPPSWSCVFTQNPLSIFFSNSDPSPMDNAGGQQCWLALINATGMISTMAYLLLAITSLAWVRRYSYKLFYCVHIPAAWVMLVMAIWHYPSCALIIIPNIIYYLSFHVPVLVAQAFAYRTRLRSKNASPLVEANLIQGGSVELVFATGTEYDRRRHESLFVRVFHPAVSSLTHPFSVFSPDDLQQSRQNQQQGTGSSDTETLSILLRPSGPFTDGLTKVLFPPAGTVGDHQEHDLQLELEDDHQQSLISDSTNSPCRLLQFDAYYAGSFDWVDNAARSHDRLLLVAGGVGIVPFLDFLPALQRAISASTNTGTGYIPVAGREEEAAASVVGPKQIHLHWYCREVGLASHVWHKYLCHHVAVWEKAHPGRLTIHVHLTSSSLQDGGDEPSTIMPNVELANSKKYTAVQSVKDTTFVHSWLLSLLLPGSLMTIGTAVHWYWFNSVTMADAWRSDFLILRAHAILFSLVAFFIISVTVEFIMAKRDAAVTNTTAAVENSAAVATPPPVSTTIAEAALKVTNGRPAVESVIASVFDAKHPGVFMCGPQALMESVETSIRGQRKDCGFYREDSEM